MPCLELNYEDHLSDTYRQKETCKIIFDLFNIGREEVSSSLKKITTDKLSDSVENAEALIKVVTATEFAEYVADVSI